MATIVTTAEVEDTTGLSVAESDILQAQMLIQAVTGLNLVADNPELRFTKTNLRILKDAVILQTQFLQVNPDVITRNPDIASVSQKNISVSYKEGGEGFISPVVSILLKQLTGNSGFRSIAITPRHAYSYESPLTDEIVWKY